MRNISHYLLKLLFFYALLAMPLVQRFILARRRTCAAILVVFLCLLPAGTIAGALVAAGTNRIVGHDEVTILSIAAAHYNGQVMYPTSGDTGNYALLYGPLTFLAYELPMTLGAVRTATFQAFVAIVLTAAYVVLWFALRKRTGNVSALLGVAFVAALLCRNTDAEWGTKGDVFILLFAALGLCAALRARVWMAGFVVAVCAAAMLDIKITTAPIALLPAALLLVRTPEGKRASLVALFACPILTALPFFLPGVGIHGYIAVLNRASHHGLSRPNSVLNASELFRGYCLPIASVILCAAILVPAQVKSWFRGRVIWLALLLLSAVTCAVTGSKHGAGPWHMMPLTVPIAYLAAEMFSIIGEGMRASEDRGRALLPAATFAPLLALFGTVVLLSFVDLKHAINGRLYERAPLNQVSHGDVETDLLAFAAAHPGSTIQMGYGDDSHYAYTYTRQVLLRRGQRLLIDANVQNEEDLEHAPEPLPVLASLRQCGIQLWLIPKGTVPFSMTSLYYREGTIKQPEMFPRSFQQAFFDHYRRGESTRFFDVWVCKDQHGTS